MAFYWIVFTILTITVGLLSEYLEQSVQLSDFATLDSLSRNMLVYRSAAAEYAKGNTAFSGVPPDAALNLPAWFSKPTGVVTLITAGQSYTYFYGEAPAGLPAALAERTQSILIGVNRSGVLVSPSSGQTGVPLPSAIPEGAVVAVN